jgi:3'-5' exoribonuclease
MLKQKELASLSKGDEVDHYLLIKRFELRLTKQNKQYLSLELGDKSVSLNANIFEQFEKIYETFNLNNVVKVKGVIDDYQGTRQIKINSMVPAELSGDISVIDFLPKSVRNPDEMKEEFRQRVDRINNTYLKTLMHNIFNEKNFLKYSLAPAGKAWHHGYIHGLLEHTLEIIKICDLMCDIHPEINRDLLICGALMHDFGKIEELKYDGAFEYTDKGKLIGHIVISAILINEEAKKIPGFPEELKNCLIHIILSHQGKLEHASPVIPKTLEAIALYQADELSAKVNAYKNALATQMKSDSKWTSFLNLAETDLFKHSISGEPDDDINKTLFD